jgi:hypothetical protein
MRMRIKASLLMAKSDYNKFHRPLSNLLQDRVVAAFARVLDGIDNLQAIRCNINSLK